VSRQGDHLEVALEVARRTQTTERVDVDEDGTLEAIERTESYDVALVLLVSPTTGASVTLYAARGEHAH
jgi:hypothetical protein